MIWISATNWNSQQLENKFANSLQVLLVLWFKYKDFKGLHMFKVWQEEKINCHKGDAVDCHSSSYIAHKHVISVLDPSDKK